MWYFAWMLGLPLAVLLAVVNAIWLEMQHDDKLLDEFRPRRSRDEL